ncbi:PTS mannitol transporter subunit IICBA [Clostridium sp. AL.422]|nr:MULTISPECIES: PTS mannitol transporter subunit IICBA [unclassified Clostridium]MDV4149270.1 PTS mannitol transporter subunit IICBA [Clostridium sp. AL.422]
MKAKIQVFGRFLSSLVMPNIGAFIAWGFMTALFIPEGWFPNERLAALIEPMIKYLLPLLVGIKGGNIIAGYRGGLISAVVTMAMIVGADVPILIGAMIIGPLSAYVIKIFDKLIEDRIPAGFEMLVNNFSMGIISMILALIAFLTVGPIISGATTFLKNGAEVIISKGFIPLISIFIEPAKILFLNNAINHGVLSPIGMEQAKEAGKSIMFLLESNPGPGLGIILAYLLYGKGAEKQSALGAWIIHFFGGIHEIYFPYVLMNPLLLLAVISGGMAGTLIFSILGAGLVATPSPGSIFALMALSPKGGIFQMLVGVIVATAVSFIIAIPFVKMASKNKEIREEEEIKREYVEVSKIDNDEIKKIVFACDAGMGSSAMGATRFKKRIKNLGLKIEVTNSSVDAIPEDADLVISHIKLVDRVKRNSPNAEHIFIDDFLSDRKIDKLFERFENNMLEKLKQKMQRKDTSNVQEENDKLPILSERNIVLGLESESKEEAIKRAGNLLVKGGYVKESYVDAMLEREEVVSTYIGMGVAIPHGIGVAKREIKSSGIVVLQYPNGVDFGEELAYLVVGIAGVGDEHIEILSNIAISLEDMELVERLKNTKSVDEILEVFQK